MQIQYKYITNILPLSHTDVPAKLSPAYPSSYSPSLSVTLSSNIQFLERYSDFIAALIDEVWRKISYDKGLYQFGILETSPYFDTTRNYFPMQEIN